MSDAPAPATSPIRDFFQRFGRSMAVELENDLEQLSRLFSDDHPDRIEPVIMGFAGYRNDRTARIKARIVRKPRIKGAPNSTIAKMHAMYRLYNSHELPGTFVILEAWGQTYHSASDEEGYVSFEIAAPPPEDDKTRWEAVTMRLADDRHGHGPLTIPVLRAGTDRAWAIISDIDDTIIETGAQNFVKNWRKVLVDQVDERVAVPGAGNLYRTIAGDYKAPTRPFFYVSSSPWNLYGFLTSFMEKQQIPHGPMFLKDYGIEPDKFIDTAHSDHKLDAIQTILAFYPEQKFLLIGDNGQHDVEIYAEAVKTYPGRIGAVYIRDVSGSCASGTKAELLEKIRGSGIPVWCGAGFDDAIELTNTLDLMKPVEAAKAIEAGKA